LCFMTLVKDARVELRNFNRCKQFRRSYINKIL